MLLNGWILPTGEAASGRVCPEACAAGLFSISSVGDGETDLQKVAKGAGTAKTNVDIYN